jgi:hypothetical protein
VVADPSPAEVVDKMGPAGAGVTDDGSAVVLLSKGRDVNAAVVAQVRGGEACRDWVGVSLPGHLVDVVGTLGTDR